MEDISTYRPAGPTLTRFHESDALTRLIAGPVGSAKTTGCTYAEPMFTAMMQKPDADGVRTAQVGVLRDTYRNLYRTTLKSWLQFVPKEFGKFVGSDDRPAIHEIEFPAPYIDRPGRGPCKLTVEFLALGPNTVETVCGGWQVMGAFLDEAHTLPIEAIPFVRGRTLRGGDVRYRYSRGLWGAFNKPDIDHPLHAMCVEDASQERIKGRRMFEFFDQPAGLLPGMPFRTNPEAENLQHLDEDYYVKLAIGAPQWYVTRMLRNQWGASVAGEPIFPEFQQDLHMLKTELDPEPGAQLTVGFDAGGTPAAVIMGRDRYGRRVIYAELVLVDPDDPRKLKLQHGVGPRRFGRELKDLLGQPRFRRCVVSEVYGDPAAQYGADRENGEYSWLETVGNELGVPVLAAPSNEIALRHEAVRGPLRTLAPDGQPMLMINPSCRWVRAGFASDYKWEERDPKQPGKVLKPQKSRTSHVHDALQYALLADTGRAGVTAGDKFDRWRPTSRNTGAEVGFADLDRLVARHRGFQDQAGGGPQYKADFSPWDW